MYLCSVYGTDAQKQDVPTTDGRSNTGKGTRKSSKSGSTHAPTPTHGPTTSMPTTPTATPTTSKPGSTATPTASKPGSKSSKTSIMT